jgi:predicted MFS family arabinose efflux permease
MTEISIRPDPSWVPILSVAAGTFAMVTTEFLPIGLMSRISSGFGVSEGQAGLLVTIPGFVAAIAAPAVTLLAGKADRRLLLLLFSALIVVSNLVVAFAPTFAVAVAGRALLGASVGGFWTFAAAIGRRLVGEGQGNRATSIIMAGISIGTVIGVPIGTLVGNLFGWRMAFGAAGLLCLAILTVQVSVLPSLAAGVAPTLRALGRTFRNKDLAFGLLVAAVASCAHFTAYTYLEPHLVEGLSLAPSTLGWLLALYGIAGVFGTFAGEAMCNRSVVGGLFTSTVGMGLAITLAFASNGLGIAAISVALWGLSFGAIPVCVQIWTYKSNPDRFETNSAIMVAVFQVAIAMGSFVGGEVVDLYGLNSVFLVGALLSLCCVCLLVLYHIARAEPGTAHSN